MKKTTTGDRLLAAMLGGLSAEGIDRRTNHEVRQGYPKATVAKRQILFDDGKKNGFPAHNLAHAKQIASPCAEQQADNLSGHCQFKPLSCPSDFRR
jgi:hypothetical protein